MTPVDSALQNPILQETRARLREALLARFPPLSQCTHENYISLQKYLEKIPEHFFSHSVYEKFQTWLCDRDQKDRPQLQSYLSQNEWIISSALLHLEEINANDWHDTLTDQLQEFEKIRFIEQRIHPTYLRLLEAVFCPFLKIVAHFSRIDRRAGTEGLDLWSVVQELKETKLSPALRSYHHIARNGIGHGGITYLVDAIRYRDKKGNEKEYSNADVIRMCDDLLDTCNALALAFSVFLFSRQSVGYELPRQLLVEELKADTYAPWWEIDGCVSHHIDRGSQLVIFANTTTRDYRKVQHSTFQTGILAERYAPGFDRYFVSIRSAKALPGFAAFDGNRLRDLRESNSPLENYSDVIEDNLIFYSPHFQLPRVFARVETLRASFKVHAGLAVADFRRRISQIDVKARSATIHQNSWGSVLNGKVVIRDAPSHINKEAIRNSCGLIVSRALSLARKKCSWLSFVPYLPIGFAQISVYQKNYRNRRLADIGLGSDLVCTVRIHRIRRINAPDIAGSTIEQKGKYRIAWNRNWVESHRAPPSRLGSNDDKTFATSKCDK